MTNVPLVENIARGGEYMCLELTEYPGDDIGALIGALDEFASVEARWRRGNGSNGDDRIEHHVTRMVAIPSPLKSANSRGSIAIVIAINSGNDGNRNRGQYLITSGRAMSIAEQL
ncbi:hypothetical protein CIB48_g8975 [Xylaria polymorpha]|nr:hypothetical protein CIB48_g8975 [Xylaria polymorpha]